jgi:hypothetical protein
LQALSSGAFDHRLDDTTKARLMARATMRSDAMTSDAARASRAAVLAAERAHADRSFQAVSDLNRRLAVGQATHTDIADAESRGTLTADEASRLRDQLAVADQARAAEATAATRVARTLSDGNSLDPSSPADRAAVDAHWRTSVVPTLDANPASDTTSAIIDYVSAIGTAPPDALRRLTGQCFDGVPTARVAAARALADSLRIDPEIADSVPPEIREAVVRTASLADVGLPPGKALAPVDAIEPTTIPLRSTAFGWANDVNPGANANGTSPGAAGATTGTSASNTPIPPKPAYKAKAFPDADWRHWIGALSNAGLPPVQARVYQEIFAAEGGSNINPKNGAKSGITQETLNLLVGHGLVPGIRSGTLARDLTISQRVEAYNAFFRNVLQFAPGKERALDAIGDPEVATSFAYTLFHHYAGERERAIQGAVNDVVPGRLAEDGVIGRQTIDAYAELARDPSTRRQLLNALADRQEKLLYVEAARKDKKDRKDRDVNHAEAAKEGVAVDQGDLDIVKHLRFLPQPPAP